jgi:hypothetical protein
MTHVYSACIPDCLFASGIRRKTISFASFNRRSTMRSDIVCSEYRGDFTRPSEVALFLISVQGSSWDSVRICGGQSGTFIDSMTSICWASLRHGLPPDCLEAEFAVPLSSGNNRNNPLALFSNSTSARSPHRRTCVGDRFKGDGVGNRTPPPTSRREMPERLLWKS